MNTVNILMVNLLPDEKAGLEAMAKRDLRDQRAIAQRIIREALILEGLLDPNQSPFARNSLTNNKNGQSVSPSDSVDERTYCRKPKQNDADGSKAQLNSIDPFTRNTIADKRLITLHGENGAS